MIAWLALRPSMRRLLVSYPSFAPRWLRLAMAELIEAEQGQNLKAIQFLIAITPPAEDYKL
jgi:hypothetical protein